MSDVEMSQSDQQVCTQQSDLNQSTQLSRNLRWGNKEELKRKTEMTRTRFADKHKRKEPKSSTERSREMRARKKLLLQSANDQERRNLQEELKRKTELARSRYADKHKRKEPKSSTERSREMRARKKLLLQSANDQERITRSRKYQESIPIDTNEKKESSIFKYSVKIYEDTDPKEVQDYNMNFFQALEAHRKIIATEMYCPPHVVATDTALVKLLNCRPENIDEFLQCNINNFDEAAVVKVGQRFIEFIKGFTDKNKAPTDRKEIKIVNLPETSSLYKKKERKEMPVNTVLLNSDLKWHNLSGLKFNNSMKETYTLFKNGSSIQEIMKSRNLAQSTIETHLIDVMKAGYPIKLKDIGLTEKNINIILNAIEQCNFDLFPLQQIKKLCPKDIGWGDISAVCNYLRIRKHLDSLNISYKEYDPLPIKKNECKQLVLSSGDEEQGTSDEPKKNSSFEKEHFSLFHTELKYDDKITKCKEETFVDEEEISAFSSLNSESKNISVKKELKDSVFSIKEEPVDFWIKEEPNDKNKFKQLLSSGDEERISSDESQKNSSVEKEHLSLFHTELKYDDKITKCKEETLVDEEKISAFSSSNNESKNISVKKELDDFVFLIKEEPVDFRIKEEPIDFWINELEEPDGFMAKELNDFVKKEANDIY